MRTSVPCSSSCKISFRIKVSENRGYIFTTYPTFTASRSQNDGALFGYASGDELLGPDELLHPRLDARDYQRRLTGRQKLGRCVVAAHRHHHPGGSYQELHVRA